MRARTGVRGQGRGVDRFRTGLRVRFRVGVGVRVRVRTSAGVPATRLASHHPWTTTGPAHRRTGLTLTLALVLAPALALALTYDPIALALTLISTPTQDLIVVGQAGL